MAREQYEALAAAWLPHWLEEGRKAALAGVGPAVQAAAAAASQGAAAAAELWTAHGAPAVAAGTTLARDSGAALGARLDAALSTGVLSKQWAGAKAAAAKHWPRLRGAAVGVAVGVARTARAAW